MPVLTTIATVSYLFARGGKGNAGFLDPMGLRKKMEKLKDEDSRRKSLVLMDQLDDLAQAYDAATTAAMDAYVADIKQWKSSAEELVEIFEPQDRVRAETLPKLIELRQRLLDTLSPEEWDKVFS